MNTLPEDQLSVGMIIPNTQAEGPGKRFALWVQGCPMRCAGCCNPEYLEFTQNNIQSVDDVFAQVQKSHQEHQIEGVTFLGGEPFSHAQPLAALAKRVQDIGLTVMIFTGYSLKSLKRSEKPGVAQLLATTDLLVDGPFIQSRLDKERRWIGSTNQTPYDLTGAYKELVDNWDTSPETLEIRIVNGKLVVNGSPFLIDKLGRKQHI